MPASGAGTALPSPRPGFVLVGVFSRLGMTGVIALWMGYTPFRPPSTSLSRLQVSEIVPSVAMLSTSFGTNLFPRRSKGADK